MVWQLAVQRCVLHLSINYAIKYRLTRYKFPKHLKFKQCLENCILLLLFLHRRLSSPRQPPAISTVPILRSIPLFRDASTLYWRSDSTFWPCAPSREFPNGASEFDHARKLFALTHARTEQFACTKLYLKLSGIFLSTCEQSAPARNPAKLFSNTCSMFSRHRAHVKPEMYSNRVCACRCLCFASHVYVRRTS